MGHCVALITPSDPNIQVIDYFYYKTQNSTTTSLPEFKIDQVSSLLPHTLFTIHSSKIRVWPWNCLLLQIFLTAGCEWQPFAASSFTRDAWLLLFSQDSLMLRLPRKYQTVDSSWNCKVHIHRILHIGSCLWNGKQTSEKAAVAAHAVLSSVSL